MLLRAFFSVRITQQVKSASLLRDGLALGAALAGIAGWGSLLVLLSV